MSMEPDSQLELFTFPEGPISSRNRLSSIGTLQIRQDHAVLVGIVGLIGLSVVFALGVERGKQLARAERIGQQESATPASHTSASSTAEAQARASSKAAAAPESTSAPAAKAPVSAPELASESSNAQPNSPADTSSQPSQKSSKKTAAKKTAATKSSQFAVQVVSYRQAELAQKEMQRLKQRGEHAFVLLKQGKAALMVGPFSTKETATAKLTDLKSLYRDCFLRSL